MIARRDGWVIRRSGVERVAAAEFDFGRVGVLTDAASIVTHHGSSFVHFFRENAVCRMKELGVTAREDPVDLVILNPRLELGAQLGSKRQALLLASEIHDVFA